jgi:hypothetical protein
MVSHLRSHSARETLGPLRVFQGPVAIFNRCLDGPLVIEWLDLDDQHASRRERWMPRFDPRSFDDDGLRPISPHPSPKPKSKWPPTRVLGWVIAVGGLSVALNVVPVVAVYVAMARMDSRLTSIEQWMAREHETRQKVVDDWPEIQRRPKEFDADLAKAKDDIKRYNTAGGVTGEVTRDLQGQPASH